MAKGCKKCDPHEICEECPEWIFTLADLIMCMMGLFVILWVLKPGMTTPPTPTAAAAASNQFDMDMGRFRDGFSGIDTNSANPDDPTNRSWRQRYGKGQGGDTTIKRDSPAGTDEQNTSIRPGKESAVGGRLLFEPGSTHFTPETTRALDEIANIIRGHRNIVLVKGHTALDDLPEDASAEEKMALSLQRAKSVADYLTSKNVEPEILRVQGCSTFEPVKQRTYSPDGMLLNRRVEVMTTSNLVEELQDRPAPATVKEELKHPAKPEDKHEEVNHGAEKHGEAKHGE